MPDLEASGLKLVGGRLLPGPFGPAAFFMYEGPSGERFTIYYARTDAPQTALRYRAGERFAAFYWVENGLAYVVSGPGDRERLLQGRAGRLRPDRQGRAGEDVVVARTRLMIFPCWNEPRGPTIFTQ